MPTTLQKVVTLFALIVWMPGDIAASPESEVKIGTASISGRITVLGLIDALHDQRLDIPERKKFYTFYLRQQLDVAGLTDLEALTQAHAQGVERTMKAVGEAKLDAVSRAMRTPYEKPFTDGSQIQISESEKKAIKEYFNRNYTAGNTAMRSGSTDSLTKIDLGTIMLGNMRICLDGWASGRVVPEASNPKLFHLVVASLEKTISRLSEDETMINEAWREAVSYWLKK
ncbi:hypothetical protein DES53_110137 [Roseimicrobium gellanilyticum]|uniref:Uncharacterized protein n=1 Tax=Roseimicrobium gellanilyticum TaxID=748857 RepID=A0A366HC53_9BACT|nr:hypothetical protein [Roseimicrobium gellanilyticum]RBP39113.1 hypothetical protein DES53_110137 [Roseimicrobium gellanilyticum]